MNLIQTAHILISPPPIINLSTLPKQKSNSEQPKASYLSTSATPTAVSSGDRRWSLSAKTQLPPNHNQTQFQLNRELGLDIWTDFHTLIEIPSRLIRKNTARKPRFLLLFESSSSELLWRIRGHICNQKIEAKLPVPISLPAVAGIGDVADQSCCVQVRENGTEREEKESRGREEKKKEKWRIFWKTPLSKNAPTDLLYSN